MKDDDKYSKRGRKKRFAWFLSAPAAVLYAVDGIS